MPSYILLAIFAAIFFSVSGILNKITSKHAIDNKNSLMAYFLLFSFIFGLFLFPFISPTLPPIKALLPLSITFITFIIGYYFFFAGIFQTDASSFAPLFQIQGGLIALLAFLFLGERFPLINYLWIVLLIIGAVLVVIDESMSLKSFIKPGILLILLMQLLHAISNLFVGFTLKHILPMEILFWQYMAVGFLSIPFIFLVKPKLKYPPKSLLPMFIASSSSATGAIFLFTAFKTNLTIPGTIAMLDAPIIFIVSILASKFFPQLLEHHPAKVYLVRSLGLIIILFSAFKLTTG